MSDPRNHERTDSGLLLNVDPPRGGHMQVKISDIDFLSYHAEVRKELKNLRAEQRKTTSFRILAPYLITFVLIVVGLLLAEGRGG